MMRKKRDMKSLGRLETSAMDIKLTGWRPLKCQYAWTEESYESSYVFFQGTRQRYPMFRSADMERLMVFGRFLRDRGIRFGGRDVQGEIDHPQKVEWSHDWEFSL
jgi:hypothetical protein